MFVRCFVVVVGVMVMSVVAVLDTPAKMTFEASFPGGLPFVSDRWSRPHGLRHPLVFMIFACQAHRALVRVHRHMTRCRNRFRLSISFCRSFAD